MGLTGPVRNLLATVLSLVIIAALYYMSVTPEYLAVFNKFYFVTYPVMVFMVNTITKLTTWKGDDSLGSLVIKRLRKN